MKKSHAKTMSPLPPKKMAGLSKDLVTEIALYLPLKSLFQCRAVCKLWRDVIDSPFFRKLHIHIRSSYSYKEEDEDEKVYLQLNYDEFDDSDVKVSIKVVEKGKSVDLNLGFSEAFPCPRFMLPLDVAQVIRPVVEVVQCPKHRHHHVHLYSRRTDSWRKLGDLDQYFRIMGPIMLSCSDGHFVHWYGSYIWQAVLLTFDMKNEVFSTIKMSTIASIPFGTQIRRTVAKDDNSFIVIIPPENRSNKLVRIFESSICEENGIRILSWNHVVDLEEPVVQTMSTPLPLWRRDCVMLRFFSADRELRVLFYDYVARRFIGCFELPCYSKLFSYKGTFISP